MCLFLSFVTSTLPYLPFFFFTPPTMSWSCLRFLPSIILLLLFQWLRLWLSGKPLGKCSKSICCERTFWGYPNQANIHYCAKVLCSYFKIMPSKIWIMSFFFIHLPNAKWVNTFLGRPKNHSAVDKKRPKQIKFFFFYFKSSSEISLGLAETNEGALDWWICSRNIWLCSWDSVLHHSSSHNLDFEIRCKI